MMTNDDGTANLKAITSRWDRVADLDYSKKGIADTFSKGQEGKVSDDVLRFVRHKQGHGKSGLLVVYPINRNSEVERPDAGTETSARIESAVRMPLSAADHVIGISVMFPETPNHYDAVDYYAAKVDAGYLEDVDSEAEMADDLDEKRAEIEEAKTL